MLAADLAVSSLLSRQSDGQLHWAINLAGGYHHASADRGGGFCIYADISLAIVHAHARHPQCERVLIVDLDAHQGNGHEMDLLQQRFPPTLHVTTLDLYNASIYPHDTTALRALLPAHNVPLRPGTDTAEYMRLLTPHLAAALAEAKPQLVVYNAGTDLLEGDELGRLSVDRQGVVLRDEEVFRQCKEAGAAVVMLMSGGYQQVNGEIIAESIANLHDKFGLFNDSG